MALEIHRAESRGAVDHGWLRSRHSFSFGSWYDPRRMGFGLLRVLNDDIVRGGGGFGTHPHDNMEIVSIPLRGGLRHKDSMGNVHGIRAGEVQIMSAGTGITHSEYNEDEVHPVNFLQIWVLPKERDIAPRYDQRSFDPQARRNRWQTVVAPDDGDGAVVINQDAWFSLADLDAGQALEYPLRDAAHGVYLFVIDGTAEVAGEKLASRDAAGVSGVDRIGIASDSGARVLLIEVPMHPGGSVTA